MGTAGQSSVRIPYSLYRTSTVPLAPLPTLSSGTTVGSSPGAAPSQPERNPEPPPAGKPSQPWIAARAASLHPLGDGARQIRMGGTVGVRLVLL